MTGTDLAALKDAADVVITDHALEKGVDPDTVRETVAALDVPIYLDTENGRFHLVGPEHIIVVTVRHGQRVVVTVFPNDETPRYQQDRFELLRG